jgi:REP element-mobilizing transposase RayT
MARKLRIQYPGAIYHVMNRGDRREAIFEDDEDRQRLLKALTEACEKTGWQVHAHCLMRNHFHLVIETPQPNLVAGMKWLLGTYTSRFNRRHKEFGHLFSGRYKALIVDGSGNGYLFCLEQVDTPPGPSHFGEVVQEAEAAQAERRVVEGLQRMGWSEADLRARRKGEPGKIELAWELRSQTTMPLAWIAERLNMGTRGHLAWLLQHRDQNRLAAPADQCLLRI